MKLSSAGISNGYFDNRFGKNTPNHGQISSPPLRIEDAPENTVSFAFFLEDKDAIPVSGFSWIHWVACNLTESSIEENSHSFTEGVNSKISPLAGSLSIQEATGYGRMAPPDKDHYYEWQVFALDTLLDLQSGFYANELFHAMRGHILDSATLGGWYRA